MVGQVDVYAPNPILAGASERDSNKTISNNNHKINNAKISAVARQQSKMKEKLM